MYVKYSTRILDLAFLNFQFDSIVSVIISK